ncbi:MAG: fibronectin type III domain-containing protein [Elusimicrobiota bacterium]
MAFAVDGSGEVSVLAGDGVSFRLHSFTSAGDVLWNTFYETTFYSENHWLSAAIDPDSRRVFFGYQVMVGYYCVHMVGVTCPPPEMRGDIYYYDFEGNYVGGARLPGGANAYGSCYAPTVLEGDGAGGFYVADGGCRHLLKYAADGTLSRDQALDSSSSFNPRGMWRDAEGSIYISQDVCLPSGCEPGVAKYSGSGQLIAHFQHDSPHGAAWDGRILYLGTGGGAPLRRFVLDGAPAVPAETAPLGNLAQHAASAELFWQRSSDPESDPVLYDVYLGTAPGGLSRIGSTAQTRLTTPPLVFGATYYWQVVAGDSHLGLPLLRQPAPVVSFTMNLVNAAPGDFAVRAGSGTAVTRSDSVRLSWTPAADPDGDLVQYEVFWRPKGILDPTMFVTTATALDVGGLAFGSTYYWAVRAADPYGEESWLAGRELQEYCPVFRNSAPVMPSSYLSGDGVYEVHAESVTIDLAWDAAADADADSLVYTVFAGSSPAVMAVMATQTATHVILASFPVGATIHWRADAADPYGGLGRGKAARAAAVFVNAPPSPFSVLSGTGTVQTRSTAAELSWSPAVDMDGDPVEYTLHLSTEAGSLPAVYTGADNRYLLHGIPFGTTYYWSVVARDPYGALTANAGGPQSLLHVFRNGAPSVPHDLTARGTNPFHGLEPALSFFWEPAADPDGDAVSYWIGFGTDTRALDLMGPAELGRTIQGLSVNTAYYYRILARDAFGAESDSPVSWVFFEFVNEPPGRFEAVGGTGTYTTRDTSRLLSWTAAIDPDGDPVTYRVVAGPSPQAMAKIRDTQATSVLLDGMAFGTTYYWTVAAWDSLGGQAEAAEGPYALRHLFKNAAPPVPAIVSGSGVSAQHTFTPEARLEWSPSVDPDGDAVRYMLALGTSEDNIAFVLDGPATSYDLPDPQFNTTYYWVVAAVDEFGGVATTEVQHLSIVLDNAAPEAFEPSSGAGTLWTRDAQGTLSWEAAHDPDGDLVLYELAVSTDSGALETVQVSTARSRVLPVSLGTTYYWRVTARDGFGGETVSGPHALLVAFRNSAPSVPRNLTPAGTIPFHGLDPLLSFFWEPSVDPDGDAMSYWVGFGTDSKALDLTGPAELGRTVQGLSVDTPYYYHIVARDAYGAESPSPVLWVFFEFANEPPGRFEAVSGTGTYTTRDASRTLSWTPAVDPDGDPVAYRVLVGTSSVSLALAAQVEGTSFVLDGLDFAATYYWTVEARDTLGGVGRPADGPFFLRHVFKNAPMGAPHYREGFGTQSQRTLTPGATVAWEPVSDPDGDPVRYELYCGTEPAALALAADTAVVSMYFGGLSFGTTYYWRVVAYDPYSRSEGPVVSLLIALDNRAPNPIRYLSPVSISTRAANYTLAWENTGDPDGEVVAYAFELGAEPAALVPVVLATPTAYDLRFEYGATYYYRVSAVDGFAARTRGEVRAFIASFLNDPPDRVALEAPFASAPVVRSMRDGVELAWDLVSSPQGDPITYTVYLGEAPERLEPIAHFGQAGEGNQAAAPSGASGGARVSTAFERGRVRLIISGLAHYQVYYLKVAAETPYGARSETALQTFSLAPANGFPAAYNYPNPFSPLRGGTRIVFNAPSSGFARAVVRVYSEMQDLIFEQEYPSVPPGVSEVAFEGRDRFGRPLFNGSYICRVRFEGPDHEETFYMLVVK